MPNVSREDIAAMTSIVTIELQKADYWPQVQKKLKEYRQKAQIKGFRPGQVPMPIIKRKFGQSLLMEEIDAQIDKALKDYVEAEKIDYLAQPLPIIDQEFKPRIDSPSDYIFKVELGLVPDVELQGVSLDNLIPYYDIEVAEEAIDEESERLRKRLGSGHEEGVDDIALGDIVVFNLFEMEGDTRKERGISKEDAFISVDRIKSEELKEAVLNAKVGDIIDIENIFEIEDTSVDNIRRYLLGVTAKTIVNPSFKGEIKEVKRIKAAELNEDFFKQLFPEDEINTVEDYRKRLEEEIKRAYKQRSMQSHLRALYLNLLEQNKFELPEEFLKRWLRQGQNAAPEVIEEQFGAFTTDLRWSIVRSKLATKYEVEVTAEDIENVFRGEILRYYRYQVAPFSDMVNDLVKRMMSDNKAVQQRYDNLLNEQVLLKASEDVGKDSKTVSLQDFEAMLEEEEEKENAENNNEQIEA